MQEPTNKSGLATAGMVLGIIAIVGAWIPFLNFVSIILGVLAFIFGIIPLVKKRSTGKAVAAVILGILSVVISIAMIVAAGNAIDKALSPTTTTPSETTIESSEGAEEVTFDGAAAFDQITNGMTKQQVRDIAGVDPASCTENQSDLLGTTEFCSYGNMFVDDVTFSITYSEGVVSSKTKSTN